MAYRVNITTGGPKACANCGEITGNPRKRVCRACGGWAIWRQLTEREAAERSARRARVDALLDELLAERTLDDVAKDKSWAW